MTPWNAPSLENVTWACKLPSWPDQHANGALHPVRRQQRVVEHPAREAGERADPGLGGGGVHRGARGSIASKRLDHRLIVHRPAVLRRLAGDAAIKVGVSGQ